MRIVSFLYLVCGIVACALLFNDLRTDPDAFVGMNRSMAWVLSLPWSLISPLVPDGSTTVTLLLFIIGILLNFAALRWLADHAR